VGLLRKAKAAAIEVTLPAKFDEAWARDGITEKPTQRVGQRQWWAQQVIAAVPAGALVGGVAVLARGVHRRGGLRRFRGHAPDRVGRRDRAPPRPGVGGRAPAGCGTDGRGALRVQLLDGLAEPERLRAAGRSAGVAPARPRRGRANRRRGAVSRWGTRRGRRRTPNIEVAGRAATGRRARSSRRSIGTSPPPRRASTTGSSTSWAPPRCDCRPSCATSWRRGGSGRSGRSTGRRWTSAFRRCRSDETSDGSSAT